MQKATWLAVVIILGAISSFAQQAPSGDVAASYSIVHFGAGSNALGGSFSAAGNVNRWFGIAGDFGAYNESPTKTFTFLAGPRFSVRTRRSRITPYAETLFGGAHMSTNGFGSTGFSALVGGGVDFGMSPSVALRPQVDYLAIRAGGSNLDTARISIGVAFNLGQKRSRRR